MLLRRCASGMTLFSCKRLVWTIVFLTNLVLWLLLLGFKLSSWNLSTGNFRTCGENGFVECDGVYRNVISIVHREISSSSLKHEGSAKLESLSSLMQSMIQIYVIINLNFNWSPASFCILTPILELGNTIFRNGTGRAISRFNPMNEVVCKSSHLVSICES
jgi:hypothetical protein